MARKFRRRVDVEGVTAPIPLFLGPWSVACDDYSRFDAVCSSHEVESVVGHQESNKWMHSNV
jgi:hypothetical protein